MSELAKILIGVLSTLLTALVGILIKAITAYYKEKKRTKALAELSNYAMGWVDTVLLEAVEMRPDLKKAGHKVSKRYHKLDIIPEVAEKSDKEK